MRRIIIAAAIAAAALGGLNTGAAQAKDCLLGAVCVANDGPPSCTGGGVNVCPDAGTCSGLGNVCPDAGTCTGGVNACPDAGTCVGTVNVCNVRTTR